MKKFAKNDTGFVCENCGVDVPPLDYSSRDHCNSCLFGKHVDINPGDRQNECRGLLVPIGMKIASGKQQIAYNCSKCSQRVFCVVAEDDNSDKILELASKVWRD